MSLFQEVAAHGLAFCAYNQALITASALDNVQKMQLIKYLLEDIKNNVIENERAF
jgi:hypothetical protein